MSDSVGRNYSASRRSEVAPSSAGRSQRGAPIAARSRSGSEFSRLSRAELQDAFRHPGSESRPSYGEARGGSSPGSVLRSRHHSSMPAGSSVGPDDDLGGDEPPSSHHSYSSSPSKSSGGGPEKEIVAETLIFGTNINVADARNGLQKFIREFKAYHEVLYVRSRCLPRELAFVVPRACVNHCHGPMHPTHLHPFHRTASMPAPNSERRPYFAFRGRQKRIFLI